MLFLRWQLTLLLCVSVLVFVSVVEHRIGDDHTDPFPFPFLILLYVFSLNFSCESGFPQLPPLELVSHYAL